MLLSGALFALFIMGVWLAWLIARRVARSSWRADRDGFDDEGYRPSLRWTDADDAVARHPAGRAMAADPLSVPRGPDDDPEFLRALSRAIDGDPPAAEEA